MFYIASSITYCEPLILGVNSINMTTIDIPRIKTMSTLIWALTLTVCWDNGSCVSQSVEQYRSEQICNTALAMYEDIPHDGKFKSAGYSCVLENGMQT